MYREEARRLAERVRLYTGRHAEPVTDDGQTWGVGAGDAWPMTLLDDLAAVERYIAAHQQGVWRRHWTRDEGAP